MSALGPPEHRAGREEQPGSAPFDRWASPGLLTATLEHAVAASVGAFVSLLALLALQDPSPFRTLLALTSAGLILPALTAYTFPAWALTLRRTMAAGILAPVGILLPILETSPGPGRSWLLGPWWILGLAPLFTVLCDQMIVAGAAARASADGRPWVRRATLSLLLVPLLSLWGVTSAPRRSATEFSRMDLAYDLHRQLTEYYPHWDTAPVRPDELWTRYRDRLERADADCGDASDPCPEYLGLLREMFAELRNGHTEILVENDVGRPAVEVASVEGRAILTGIDERSDASLAGLVRGMEIVAVDGRPVERALSLVPPWRVSFASARMRDHAAYAALLEGPADEAVRIAVRASPQSPAKVVSLHRERIRYEWESEATAAETAPEIASDAGTSPDGIVYVHVDGFEGADAEEGFDAVVDASLDAPGMILDLRDNYGGVLDEAFRMVGRLLTAPVAIGEHCVAPRDGEPRPACTAHRIEPRGTAFQGPLAVLIDENVFSAGELAAFALCRSGRARCFGTTTAGETDCVFRLDLPGAVARLSWAGFRPAFGPPLQGTGVQPDVDVPRTVRDVREGSDPALETARRWLADQRGSLAGPATLGLDVALSGAARPAVSSREGR